MATLTTPTYHFPYPDGDELVSNADAAFASLALAIDAAMSPPWTALTGFASGYSARSGYFAPAYRVFGNGTVQLRGGFTKSTAIATGDILLTLPAAARPSSTVAVLVSVSRSDATRSPAGKITIATSGAMSVEVIDIQTPASLMLDGVAFSRA